MAGRRRRLGAGGNGHRLSARDLLPGAQGRSDRRNDGAAGAATAGLRRPHLGAARQVDRITSRQMLDQQLMETKVGELLERQTQLTQRHGRLGPILDRVDWAPRRCRQPPPAAGQARVRAGTQHTLPEFALAGAAATPFSYWSTRNSTAPGESSADRADRLFVTINQSLRTIESEQLSPINTLAEDPSRRQTLSRTCSRTRG